MATVASKRLVIDTSVARAAGTTEHQVSATCRWVLETILEICHKVVATPEVSEEWKAHRSRFFATWLASMTARKKVARIAPAQQDDLRETIRRLDVSDNVRAAMEKDVRLLGAALATDLTVVSIDEEAHGYFKELAKNTATIRRVVWVNPLRPQDGTIEWLRTGAAADRQRQLGYEGS